MPKWVDTWMGGRFYLDPKGREVYVIEKMTGSQRYSVKLKTHDVEIAKAEFTRFLQDPVAYVRPPTPDVPTEAVLITEERVTLYLESIGSAVKDHRTARRKDLIAWGNYKDSAGQPLDLRTVDKRSLRVALASFRPKTGDSKRRTGGFKRRVEALNTFANFLVSEGDLVTWRPFSTNEKPASTRAERVAYSIDELVQRYRTLTSAVMRDLMKLRASTGMHHTEIAQLQGCKIFSGPLPDTGAGIRKLGGDHEIAGVLQFKQKRKPRHRISVNADVLEAALRLHKRVPSRIAVWEALDPLVPSNLRHTWITLAGEWGEWVQFRGAGVNLDQIQQIAGHSIGSKVTLSNYDKLQVPPLVRLPIKWE